MENDRELTDLEKGIKVFISKEELLKLDAMMGYLSREGYPENYEEMAEAGEIGRFLRFRLFSLE